MSSSSPTENMRLIAPKVSAVLASLLLATAVGSSSLVTGTFMVGCSTDPPAEIDRQVVLRDVTSKVILPTLSEFDAKSVVMHQAVKAFTDKPDTSTLEAAQRAWVDARAPWQKSLAFAFGPIESERLGVAIESVVDTAAIDSMISGTDSIDAAYIDAQGANKKGFLAIEYLLFDPENGNDSIVEAMQGEDNQRRRDLALALAESLADKSTKLNQAWQPTGNNFAKEFSEAGNGSKIYDSQKKALDLLINTMVTSVENVVGKQLAKPIGKRDGGTIQPDAQVAKRSDNTLVDITNVLTGVENVYKCSSGGKTGTSVSDLVDEKNTAIDQSVENHFSDAIDAAAAIKDPMSKALTSDLDGLNKLYDESNNLKNALKAEVASLLGVTLTFNDNDGD